MKPADRGHRPGRDAGGVGRPAQRGDERDPLALGELDDAGLGAVADAALGDVEDPAQVDGVGRVGDDPQVGQGVLDLAPLVEAGAADHLVGQADPHEHLLDGPGLGVGAVEDGDVLGPARRARRRGRRSGGRRTRPRRARSRRRSRRSWRRRRSRSRGSWDAAPRCGRSPRWPRAGSSGSSGSSARAGWCGRRGSPARTPRCCGSSRHGRRRWTGRRHRRRPARPAGPRGPRHRSAPPAP